MVRIDYNKPTKTSDFIDAVRIIEIKDRDYMITFFNGFSGNAYSFRIFKEVFDKMMENRKIIDMRVDVIDPNKELEEMEKKIGTMVV